MLFEVDSSILLEAFSSFIIIIIIIFNHYNFIVLCIFKKLANIQPSWPHSWTIYTVLVNLVHSVFTGKSRTEALEYWPSNSTERVRLISYLILYALFIMDLSVWSIKTNNWSADNFKRRHHLNELYTWAQEF